MPSHRPLGVLSLHKAGVVGRLTLHAVVRRGRALRPGVARLGVAPGVAGGGRVDGVGRRVAGRLRLPRVAGRVGVAAVLVGGGRRVVRGGGVGYDGRSIP